MKFLIVALLCVLIIAVGCLIGIIASCKKVGDIVINTTDPDKDVYSLELVVPFGELQNRRRVRFDIRQE